jgi:fumarate hydratase subunit alpha
MCIKANIELPKDTVKCINKALENESDNRAKNVLKLIKENADIAKKDQMPICQDTGMAVFFVEIGQDVLISGDTIQEAIDEGVRMGYKDGYLRKSVVKDPFNRVNSMDNTPSIIHLKQVKGNKIKILFAPKGFGSENMSDIVMLKPADGKSGVKDFVKKLILEKGANACPPLVVGIGIGGTMEKAAILAKYALFRETGTNNKDIEIAKFEDELLEEINRLNVGPQGFGGDTTALAVHIETFPTHIAGLPVAVNLNCHAARHEMIEI